MTSLYDVDYVAWLEETARLLDARDFDNLDLEHLIEEVEGLKKSEQRAVRSHLINLIEHVLKWHFDKASLPRTDKEWRKSIRNARREALEILSDSTTLWPYLHEQFEYCYRHGREEALESTDVLEDAIPTQSPWSLDELLTEGWLPETHVSAGQ